MTYRTDIPYDFDAQNESRADRAEWALSVATDRNGESYTADTYLDVSDLVANLMHFCDRAGLDWGDVLGHGENGYTGDHEDGPIAKRDEARFPNAE